MSNNNNFLSGSLTLAFADTRKGMTPDTQKLIGDLQSSATPAQRERLNDYLQEKRSYQP